MSKRRKTNLRMPRALYNFLPHMVPCKAIGNLSMQYDGGSTGCIPGSFADMERYLSPSRGYSLLVIGRYLLKYTYFLFKLQFGAQKSAKSRYKKVYLKNILILQLNFFHSSGVKLVTYLNLKSLAILRRCDFGPLKVYLVEGHFNVLLISLPKPENYT